MKLPSDKIGSHERHGKFVRVLVGTLPQGVVGLDFWGNLNIKSKSTEYFQMENLQRFYGILGSLAHLVP